MIQIAGYQLSLTKGGTVWIVNPQGYAQAYRLGFTGGPMLKDIKDRPYYSAFTLIVLVAAVLWLTGCAEWSAFTSGVAEHGAQAADEALEVAVWQMCNGGSVGSVTRRFDTEEERAAWNVICPGSPLVTEP